MRRRFAAGALAAALALAACSSTSTPTPTAALDPGVTPPSTATPPGGDSPGPLATIADAPDRDWLGLVERYTGVSPNPLDDAALYPKETVGATKSFWVIEPDGPSAFRIDAELRHVGEHALWYVAGGLDIEDAELAEAAATFDNDIFLQVLGTFAPGLELPGPITILNAGLPGLGGYFSSADALPADAYRFTNGRVTLFMNGTNDIGAPSYRGTLAHELQHLAHWLVDPTEDTWINEGLSEYAARSLGLPALPVRAYLRDPSVSITDWPADIGSSLPNYAGASLFTAYLADRTGHDNIHRLVAQAADGAAGVKDYLDEIGSGLTFEEVYADWLVANLVDAASGTFAYANPRGTVRVDTRLEGVGTVEGNVAQLGGWYLRIDPGGEPLQVRFEGAAATPLLPIAAHSGDACWWSNRGDDIDSSLTRELNLAGLDSATLRFWSWHEIENEWDRAYVAASTDGGRSWEALEGELTSDSDPVGSSLGPSYTGGSNGWRRERIDLSRFAGRAVLLRFNYVTDESINSRGWCVDDIEAPEVGFADDAETDGDWVSSGFLRATSAGVAQRFLLRVVTGSGDDATVEDVALDATNRATFTVSELVTIVLTAIAPKTLEPATFRFTTER